MGIREDVLALADDVESTIGGCYGCLLDKRGLCKAETDFDCNDEVCKFVAHRLRAIAENDAESVTTVSAYDLLPADERDAIAWVREHGGLDEVEKRIMPKGMEWPLYDDGEPVRIGDRVPTEVGVEELCQVHLGSSGYSLYTETCDEYYAYGVRVKRPAPKVLDADWVEIRVGDVLYRKSDGHMVKVAEIYEKTFTDADGYVRPGDGYTHRAPVFAADGLPLEVGHTVWHVGNGVEFTVIGLPRPGEYQAVKLRLDDGAVTGFDPDQLTHQRPVLDADGNRIEPSMDVWWVCEGDELGIHAEKLHVDGIDKDGMVECSPYNGGTSVALEPSELYVDKPVLDADGVPIKVGDTVWDIETGCGRTVRAVNDNETVEFDGYENRGWFGKFLTHAKPEPPDSWERIEEDASLAPGDYIKKCGRKTDLYAYQEMPIDLVRRCRALAEKENKNE